MLAVWTYEIGEWRDLDRRFAHTHLGQTPK